MNVSSRFAKRTAGQAHTLKVLGLEVLDKAKKNHRDLAFPVATWLTVATEANWKKLNELRQTWRNTDCVKGQTIFNIKGNKYRLIAVVNYAAQTIFVKMLVTHAEYSEGGWNR
jgi:mRNA interferase HigB